MFNIQIPKNHFLAADYPVMEENILGLPIPIGWGNINDIVPFCVDTDALRFKIVDQAIEGITEVRSKGIPLSAGSYTEDLAIAEITLKGTPYIVEGYTYYFAISGDYAINGASYLKPTLNTQHAGQQAYYIDGSDTWSAIAGRQLFFIVYGKMRLDLEEEMILGSFGIPAEAGALRDTAAHTRIGCSFAAPAAPRGPGWFVTRICVFFSPPAAGTPVGNLICTLFSGINPDVQQGMQGEAVEIVDDNLSRFDLPFAQDGADSDLLVDIESPDPKLTNGADILEDLVVSILGKPLAMLEPTSLANFAAKRTQELKIFTDRDMIVGDFIGKLEASLLWKFIPLQDGTYGAFVYEVGEPAGTPVFRDEDFIGEFKIEHDLSVVRNIARVKYDENPATQEFKSAEARSDYARLFYSNEETIEVETWLTQDLDAQDLVDDYSFFMDRPEVRITFEVHGWGLNLIPGRDKCRVWKSRAAWPGGAIRGELFRITKIVKQPATDTCKITAILDTDTYISPDPEPAPESGDPQRTFLPFILVTERTSDRVHGIRRDPFSSHEGAIGDTGSGDDEFSDPSSICSDGTYFYVADTINNRVVKRLVSDLSFVAKTSGAAPNTIVSPRCIVTDGTYLYVSRRSSGNIKVYKLLCSDLSYVAQFDRTNDWENNGVVNMATDGNVLYMEADGGLTWRMCKVSCATMTLIDRYYDNDSEPHLEGNAISCMILFDGILYLVGGSDSHKYFFKFDAGTMNYIGQSSDLIGTGAGQISGHREMDTDGVYLYLAEGIGLTLARVEKFVLSDFSYVAQFGSYGNGDDEFGLPWGLCCVSVYNW